MNSRSTIWSVVAAAVALSALQLGSLVIPDDAAAQMRGGSRSGRHSGGHHSGGHHGGGHHHRHPHPHPHPHMHMGFHGPMLWHPIGFVVAALAVTAIVVSASNSSHNDIYYSEGVYYEKQSDGSYKAVPAPPDAQIPALPDGYTTVGEVDGTQYFYYQGDFYVVSGDKYVAAKAPEGAVVPYVPEAAQPSTVDGKQYYLYAGAWYKAKSKDGDTVYQVTGPPS